MKPRHCALALVLIAVPGTLISQTASGRVTRDGLPVSGAIVGLTDAAGRTVARVASGDDGRYAIRAPDAGTYRLQILQIGWRPSMAGTLELPSGGSVSRDISLASARVTLPPILVNDKTECRVHPDSSAAAFAIWEAARAALVATSVTRAEPLSVTITRSDRTYDAGGSRLVADSNATQTGRSLNPFISKSPDSLAASGFADTTATGERVYWAPDADVLLSDAFLASHCLRAERAPEGLPGRGALIGVRFVPVAKRLGVVDIEGVLWVDRESAELRTLEYRYANASAVVDRAAAGGRVEFMRMPRGRWVAHTWSIRYPVVVTRLEFAPVVPGVRREQRASEELRGIKVSAGAIDQISRDGDVLWERGRVSFAVRVVDSLTAAPLGGVMVGLTSSNVATATDSNGLVIFDRIVPGTHVVRVAPPNLLAIGRAPALATIEVPAANDAIVVVRVPSVRQVVAERCGEQSLQWGEGMLFGKVARSDSSTARVAVVPVVIVSHTPYKLLGGGAPLLVDQLHDAARIDPDGFAVCGVPRDAEVRVRRASAAPGTGVSVRFEAGAVAATVVVP
jgi:hypothetical protein